MDNTTNKNITSGTDRELSSLGNTTGIDIPQDNQSNDGIIRTENGRFDKGTAPGPGRTKGKTLKEWRRETLANMTDTERKEFLKSVSNETQWKMAEGNPANILSGDKENPIVINLSKEIAEQNDIDPHSSNNSEGQN